MCSCQQERGDGSESERQKNHLCSLSGFSKKFTTVTADEKVLALRVEAFSIDLSGIFVCFEIKQEKNSLREKKTFLLNFKALAWC